MTLLFRELQGVFLILGDLQEVSLILSGLHGVIQAYRELQGVTIIFRGLQGITIFITSSGCETQTIHSPESTPFILGLPTVVCSTVQLAHFDRVVDPLQSYFTVTISQFLRSLAFGQKHKLQPSPTVVHYFSINSFTDRSVRGSCRRPK